MPTLKFSEVLSFSSEDPNHPADNILRPDTYRKWKCAAGTSEKQSYIILKLERLSCIHSIDIGNEGSAFIEVLVAREGGEFQVLLVASSFMTPAESRNGSSLSRVRMFGSDKLNKTMADQKWDRIKVICTQPFNKNMQYGLSFVTVTAPSEGSSDSTPKAIRLGSFTMKEEDDSDPISIGSVFARRKEIASSSESSPLTGAAAIRAASAAATSSTASTEESYKKKPANAPEVGFYQLKKDANKDPSKTPQSSKLHASPSASTTDRKHSDKDRDRKHTDKDRDRDRKKNHEDRNEKERDKHRKDKNQERSKANKKKEELGGVKKPSSGGGQQSTSSSSSASSKKKTAPFASLFKDVSFVLSGYQNPQRSQIRDMMLDMGARYKTEWDSSCTHLICAFSNTPKYQQVKGKGKIVNAKWISDSHKNKIRYPCKRYALDKQQNNADSEEEIWAEELLPKEERPSSKPKAPSSKAAEHSDEDSKGANYSDDTYSDNEDTDDEIERALAKRKNKEESVTTDGKATKSDCNSKEPPVKKTKTETDEKSVANSTNNCRPPSKGVNRDLNGTEDNIYDEDTDVDEENQDYVNRPDTKSLPLPSLGDYFHGKYFFVYGNMSSEMKQLVSRYIVAFDGILEEYMTDKVNFVVTQDEWDDSFDDALSENPSLQFVKPTWIWRCSDKQKFVPFQPFMVVPKE